MITLTAIAHILAIVELALCPIMCMAQSMLMRAAMVGHYHGRYFSEPKLFASVIGIVLSTMLLLS